MKANELRLGNLVNIPESVKKDFWECTGVNIITNHLEIVKIYKDEVNLLILDDEEEFDIKEIKPIELTEEWLIRFRFKKVTPRSGIQAAYKKGSIRINISNSGNFYWKNKSIPYVHTLQNVYYYNELTDEELTIA